MGSLSRVQEVNNDFFKTNGQISHRLRLSKQCYSHVLQSSCKKDRNSVPFVIAMQSQKRPKIGLIRNQTAKVGGKWT